MSFCCVFFVPPHNRMTKVFRSSPNLETIVHQKCTKSTPKVYRLPVFPAASSTTRDSILRFRAIKAALSPRLYWCTGSRISWSFRRSRRQSSMTLNCDSAKALPFSSETTFAATAFSFFKALPHNCRIKGLRINEG